MVAINAPFGLRALRHGGGGVIRPKRGRIATGASAIFDGSPIKFAADGTIAIAGTNETFLGAFVGCEYTSLGRRFVQNFFPASTVTSDAICWYYDDPAIIYAIQANGTINQADIGSQADFVNPGNGSTATGQSTAALSTTLNTTTTSQLRIIGVLETQDNAFGDAFTIVETQITRHQLAGTGTNAFA